MNSLFTIKQKDEKINQLLADKFQYEQEQCEFSKLQECVSDFEAKFGVPIQKYTNEAVKIQKTSDNYLNLAYSSFALGKFKNGITYLEKSAAEDNTVAKLNLGMIYYYGTYRKKDYQVAFYWFNKAANAGDTNAQNYLGGMYNEGDGISKNLTKAESYFKMSAEAGNLRAQYNLGLFYEFNYNNPKKK